MPAWRPSFIYTLLHEGKVFYVGQTKDTKKRFAQHCSIPQNRGKRKIQAFLFDLLTNWKIPEMKVLFETETPDECEMRIIKEYSDCNLLNMNEGGKSMIALRRAKKERPWWNKHSPVQKWLLTIKQTLNYFKKIWDQEKVEKYQNMLITLNKKIKEVWLDNMNCLLILKYGW